MRRKQQQRWHDGAGLRSSLANTPCRNTTSRQSGIYDAGVLPNPRVFVLTRHTHSQGSCCYFTNITFPEMTPSLSAPSAHLIGQAAGSESEEQLPWKGHFKSAASTYLEVQLCFPQRTPKQHVMFRQSSMWCVSMLSFHLARFNLFWYSDLSSYGIPAEVAA